MDLLRRRSVQKADDDNYKGGNKESGEQFVNSEPTDSEVVTERSENVFPNEDHGTAGDHTGDSAFLGDPFPEEAEQHQRTKSGAEPCPGEGDDFENDAVFVQSDQHTESGDDEKNDPGTGHDLFIRSVPLENPLIEVFGESGGGDQ